jgi:hypothetical protein
MVGIWQVAIGHTTRGATLVIGAGVMAIILIALWHRKADVAGQGFLEAIFEYLSWK